MSALLDDYTARCHGGSDIVAHLPYLHARAAFHGAVVVELGVRSGESTCAFLAAVEEHDGHRALRFLKGPVFAQIILADEINRTPPKTQAALLEAMQEYHVTAAGRTYELERPFFVLATQNPIELEGTYPLPEAQLDRFMFNVVMTYLQPDDEVRVVTQTTGTVRPETERVLDGATYVELAGSHFVAMERPEVVHRHLLDLLARVEHAAGPAEA